MSAFVVSDSGTIVRDTRQPDQSVLPHHDPCHSQYRAHTQAFTKNCSKNESDLPLTRISFPPSRCIKTSSPSASSPPVIPSSLTHSSLYLFLSQRRSLNLSIQHASATSFVVSRPSPLTTTLPYLTDQYIVVLPTHLNRGHPIPSHSAHIISASHPRPPTRTQAIWIRWTAS
jgi:hypothetical protein